tara:strand:+ start:613 stop:1083 length:471 start_codon:yes stop_codon:yes gene_type:complete
MNILNTHHHRLVFSIDNDAPKEYMDRWKNLKLICECGKDGLLTPKSILEQVKKNCKLQQNKNLPYLNRCEGGLGGDDNRLNKQIRFRDYNLWSELQKYTDNNIIFDQVLNTENEIWTYEELDDIIYGFIKTANYIVRANCVNGYIELKNIYGYSDL